MNASKAAAAVNLNPLHYHRTKNFILCGKVERFSGDMKLVYAHLVRLQNNHMRVFVSFDALDALYGLGEDAQLFTGSRVIIQKFLEMGLLKKHDDGMRYFYSVHTPVLEVI